MGSRRSGPPRSRHVTWPLPPDSLLPPFGGRRRAVSRRGAFPVAPAASRRMGSRSGPDALVCVRPGRDRRARSDPAGGAGRRSDLPDRPARLRPDRRAAARLRRRRATRGALTTPNRRSGTVRVRGEGVRPTASRRAQGAVEAHRRRRSTARPEARAWRTDRSHPLPRPGGQIRRRRRRHGRGSKRAPAGRADGQPRTRRADGQHGDRTRPPRACRRAGDSGEGQGSVRASRRQVGPRADPVQGPVASG